MMAECRIMAEPQNSGEFAIELIHNAPSKFLTQNPELSTHSITLHCIVATGFLAQASPEIQAFSITDASHSLYASPPQQPRKYHNERAIE